MTIVKYTVGIKIIQLMTENKQNNFVLRNSRLSNNNKTLSKPVSAGNDKHLISGYDIE